MLFTSFGFLFVFFPICLAGLFIAARLRNPLVSLLWLIGVSVVFYGWGNGGELLLLGSSLALNYSLGKFLQSARLTLPAWRRTFLALGLCANIGILAWFKYRLFLLGILGSDASTGQNIAIPLAISFFTFHQISFLVDTYRGVADRIRLERYLLFITFFPHLIAGPIIRYNEIARQIDGPRCGRPRAIMFAAGISIFIMGLSKKVLLADNLARYTDPLFGAAATGQLLTTAESWIAVLSYTMQIYFDFSGYSDMAIGLACMMGFRFPVNFYSPYKSLSIIEFWRRWHISLSRFLRDYLYVPLGGNRYGPHRQKINLMLTMALGGLWHGAGWNFVIWGVLHGAYLCVNHVFRSQARKLPAMPKMLAPFAKLAAWGLTFLAVAVAWVFFRTPDFATAKRVLSSMSGGRETTSSVTIETVVANPGHWMPEALVLLVLAGLIAFFAPNTVQLVQRYGILLFPDGKFFHATRRDAWRSWRPTLGWAIMLALCFALFVRLSILVKPAQFIYFRF